MPERASDDVAFTAALVNDQFIQSLDEMRQEIIKVGQTGTAMSQKMQSDIVSQLDKAEAKLVEFGEIQKKQGGVLTEEQAKQHKQVIANYNRLLKAVQEEIDRNRPKLKVDVVPPDTSTVVDFGGGDVRGIGGARTADQGEGAIITREDIQNLRDRLDLEKQLNSVHSQTISAIKEIDAAGEGAYKDTTEDIKLQRLALQSLYDQYTKGEKGALTTKQLGAEINRTSRYIQQQLQDVRDLQAEQSKKPAAIGEVEIAYQNVLEKVQELRDVGTETANDQADAYEQWAKDVKEVADREGQTSAELKKSKTELNQVASGAAAATKQLLNMKKTIDAFKSIDEKLQLKRIDQTVGRVSKGLNQALNSTDKEVRDIAKSLLEVRNRAQSAFRAGESSADEYEQTLEGVEDRLNRIGVRTRETGDRMSQGWGTNAWKMGNAMDRMGARSLGSVVRIHDAFKDLGPTMLAAGLGVAAITVAFEKLAKVALDVLKKIADGIITISKNSLDTAKEIELLDNQFAGLFSNVEADSERLGKVMREHLLSVSDEFGFDLTGDFAEVVVPISSSIDQVDALAEQAAILAHVRGKTASEISNAIKQATGGHFRPLTQQFGFTPAEIQTIERYQEEFGALEGVLRGMQDFTKSRGLTFDEISDSLAVMIGRAEIARKQLEILIGEPIKGEVEEQLGGMFDALDDNRDAIEALASGFGEAIASIIGTLGEHINEIIDSITDEDVIAIKGGFDNIAEGINTAITAIAGLAKGDFTTIAEGFASIAESIKSATEGLADFINFAQDFREAYEWVNTIGGNIDEDGKGILEFGRELTNITEEFRNLARAAAEVFDIFKKLFSGESYNISEWKEEFLSPLIESIPIVGDVIRTLGLEDDLREALGITTDENANAIRQLTEEEKAYADSLTDSWQRKNQVLETDEELINKSLELRDAERAYAETLEDAAEAEKEIQEARLNFFREYNERRAKIAQDQAEKEFDIELEKSRKLEDIERKRLEAFEDLAADYDRGRADITLDSYRKEEDIARDYQRKLEDIERDRGRKRIDIEQKLQEQLREIRKKYLDQLEEAARRNDAVSFLRIQRNMKRDLESAKQNAETERKNADDLARQKRDDAKIWLDRQVEDAKIAEGRKITDLLRAQAQKEQQIKKNYRRELELLEEWEERKLEDLKIWRERANDDLAKWHDSELLKLDARLEDQYAAVEKRNEAFMNLMRLNLQQALGISSQTAAAAAQAIANASIIAGFVGSGPFGVAGLSGVVGSGGSLGFNTGIGSQLNDPYAEVTGNTYGHQHGGYTPAGRNILVGETRPEAFRTSRAGIIDPNPFMFSPSTLSGGTTIDNSSRVQANIGLNDPTQMDPLMVTQVQMMITERILQARYS